jgi:uncharacterized protein YuzE
MKRGTKGQMNVDFDEYYDEECDIYYVTFKTGEPSHVVELNDILLIEVGMFTSLPTGFRILNYSKNNVKGVAFNLKAIRKEIGSIAKERSSSPSERTSQFEAALNKVLA